MAGPDFLLIAAFVVAFGLVSARVQRSPITAPMVFVGAGALLGSEALGLLDIRLEDPFVETVMELTLALILFTDAARIDASALRHEYQGPLRMLTVGMMGTIAVGTLLAVWIFPTLELWEAAVLAIVLTPTDAALGQAVVTERRIPKAVRQTLNVESGLNDGIVLPLLTVALALAGVADDVEPAGFWVRFAVREIGFGVFAGVAVGYVGGKAVTYGHRNGWMTHAFQRLAGVALAVLAFSLAISLDGNGFIAAFVAGLTIGNTAREECTPLYDFIEAEGQLLTLLTFLFFGAGAVVAAFEDLDWRTVAFALASLTVMRMVPVSLSLLGLRLQPVTHLFLGWFGPRGVASVLFGLLVLGSTGLTAGEEIFQIVTIVVVFSVVLHGVSASTLAARYGEYISKMLDHEPHMSEGMAAPTVPYMVPWRH